jgi:hypothetical protein
VGVDDGEGWERGGGEGEVWEGGVMMVMCEVERLKLKQKICVNKMDGRVCNV